MKLEKTDVWGFEHSVRGSRNPLESWNRSDSWQSDFTNDGKNGFVLGENDLKLMQRLILAGSDERKFMRQIMVSVDITAPLYWWKEMDQYKIGTVTESTSTMHKLATTPITLDCFETDNYERELIYSEDEYWNKYKVGKTIDAIIIPFLEDLRNKYLETKDKRYWSELIRWLPESWLQTRTTTMNYENLRNMYFARRNHKLSEWHTFCDWIKTLPYANELICLEKEVTK